MAVWILAALGLFVVQTFLPSTARALSGDSVQKRFLKGNRDVAPDPTVMVGRMQRALTNMIEALIVFLPLAVLAQAQGTDATTGAAIFVLARIAYVPAYAVGIPLLRSAIWTVGHVGLGMMVWAVWPVG